ncbi:MAG: hypothetical protein ACI4V4_00905 [Eubacterium sp.]
MVITTCSVGFTAFAKDYDNIWSDASEAEDAFKALNGLADDYIPSALMGIESISNGVYEKYAKEMGKDVKDLTDKEKEEIASKATLQDILTTLQPTLIGALAGESQAEYAERVGGSNPKDPSYYDYLLKDDGSLDFFTLYALCADYRTNTELSKETRDQLEEWYFQLREIYNLGVATDVVDTTVKELGKDFVDDMFGSTYENASLYALESFYNNEYLSSKCDEETLAAIEAKCAEITEEYLAYGAPEDFVVDSYAEMVYYGYGAAKNFKYAYAYTKAVKLAGEKMTYTGNGDLLGFNEGNPLDDYYSVTENITPDNFAELVGEEYFQALLGVGYEDGILMLCGYDSSDPSSYPSDDMIEMMKSQFAAMCITDFYNKDGIFSQNYSGIIKGLTIQYSDDITDADAFDALVNAKMPENYKDGNVFTEAEIKTIASTMRSLNSTSDVTSALKTGTVSGKDVFGVQIDTTLPSGMQSTYLGEYLALINEESQTNLGNTLQSYKLKVWNGFYSQYVGNNNFPWFLLNDGTPVTISQVTDKSLVMRDASTNLPVLNYDGATFDRDVIDQTVLDAERYAYTQIAAEHLGIDTFVRNSTTSLNIDINFESFVKSKAPQKQEATVELTDEQKEILYADYDLTGEMGTEIVDTILNGMILGIVGDKTVSGIINNIVTTNTDLASALDSVWGRLCNDAVSTVFELIPVLVVVVDEIILPLALNSGVPEGESFGNSNTGVTFDKEAGIIDWATIDGDLIGDLIGISFKDLSYDSGSYIGIKHLGWDLNTLLPNLMHWLLASKEDQKNKAVAGISYYVDSDTTVPVYYSSYNIETESNEQMLVSYIGTEVAKADFEHYAVKDSLGNEITREYVEADDDGNVIYRYTYGGVSNTDISEVIGADSTTEFNCYMTYEAKVPYLTGIYIADKALADARVDDLGKLLGGAISDEDLANGLAEIIAELATLFGASVDEFVNSDRVNQIRYNKGDRLFAGLNNVFVALPQLLDIMEDLAAEKYGVDKNAWTFCYDGKITTTSEGNLAGPSADKESTINAPLEDFKSWAGKNSSDKASQILDGFVSLVVEDWLNAIVSLVNNVVATDNVISDNLPIVMSLLNSLGGFGEESVFTDILNGIFQLKRGDENSFEFKVQGNGFTGLSNKNAYFLFSNIDTLVKVIVSLIDSFKGGSTTDAISFSGASTTSLISSFSAKTATFATPSSVGSSGYTAEELSSIDSLITKLDEMISSLLSSSSINDYAINNVGNIASGVVSLLSNYISSDDAESLIGLLDSYLYYLNGADSRTADENGNLKPEEVYTNENLSDLVVRTFALLENIVINLLADYDYVTGEGEQQKTYNLLSSAINGVISPDSIGVRLSDYSDAQKKIIDLKNWNSAIKADGSLTSDAKSIDWNVTAGNKDQFFDGLASSLRLVTSVLGVILIDAGVYKNALQPILATIGSYVGFTVDTAEEYADASNPYRDEVLLGLLKPIVAFLDKFLEAPATTLVKTVQALAAILDDSNTKAGTIASIVSNTITPIADEILGVSAILNVSSDKLNAASPTLAAVIEDFVNENIASLAVVDENGALANIKIKDVPLSGSNLIPIINAYLSSTGIVLNAIDWKALSEAASPAEALAYVLEYLFDTIKSNDNLNTIVGLIAGDGEVNSTIQTLVTAIQEDKIDLTGIVTVILKVLDITSNPTLFAWSFEKYLQKAIENFDYPIGLSKAQADEAVNDIDAVINNIFLLLQSLGLDLGGTSLNDVVSNNLFTNKMLTTIAVGLYGAINSNNTINSVVNALGIKTSTADFAALLTDASFGTTYTKAAEAIVAAASWAELEGANINWGFTDGAANAQQGFVNALVAILRPLNDILAIFLNSESWSTKISNLATQNLADGVTIAIDNGVIILTVVDPDSSGSVPSVIKIDLTVLSSINGTNGYNSAIIPLLEALQCKGVVTEAQYKADIAVAKDNLLLDILNPILGEADTSVLNQILAKPLETICTLLPNIAVFIDGNGLTQLIINLLAPVTNIIYSLNDVVDLNTLIPALMGYEDKSLGDCVASLLGMPEGTLTIDLTNLATLNIQDAVIPLINTLLADKGIQLNNINWALLTSLGDRVEYTSLATDKDGNALTGKRLDNVDYGKAFITVLRYVFDNVQNNLDVIQSALMGIVTDEETGATLADNKTLAPILNNVFTQLKTHTSDEIIVALYYFFVGDNTSSYWDYSKYITKDYGPFDAGGITQANVVALVKFIDDIINEIDLNSLLNNMVYTDSIINTLAELIYTNIESVNISGISLGDILEIVGITVDTESVSALLADKNYGETKQFKAAAEAIGAAENWSLVDFSTLTWGVEDQETFLKALVAILRPFEGLLDVLLADGQLNILGGITIPGSNDYVSSIVPLLEVFRCNGIKSYDEYLEDKEDAYDNILLNILTPLFGFVNDVVANPIGTLTSVLPNVSLFIANNGLIQLIVNLITPITAILTDINPIIDVDKLLQDLTGMEDISITNLDTFLEGYIGSDKLVSFINTLLESTGFQLPEIDWFYLASLGTVKNEDSAVTCIGQRIVVDGDSTQVLITVLKYLFDTVLSNKDAVVSIMGDAYTGTVKDLVDTLFELTPEGLLEVVFSVVNITQSPAEVYWCYENYKSEITKFVYPAGLTAQQADGSIKQLDDTVASVIALLGQLGVVKGANDLPGLVNSLLFKNQLLTQLAVEMYSALDTETIAPYLEMAGIPVSTQSFAAILTDTSYGATYSAAADAIKAKASWSELKTVTKNEKGEDVTTYADINWGFTDGAANAQQGFVNALVAILRPILNIVGPFLDGDMSLELGSILLNILTGLEISSDSLTIKDGILTIPSASISINFNKLTTLNDLVIKSSNGYENSIIPLLDVLQVDNSQIKSYEEYKADCAAAKDNILLDVLNPLMSFINKVLANPFDTLTSVLPNLAYFIDNNGIGQLLNNLLAPITQFLKNAKSQGLDIDAIITILIGKDLGTYVTEMLGVNVKINIQITDLASCNIQDIVVPLVNSLLKSTGIVLPDFKWSTIASHGDVVTSESKAQNSEKLFTNKEVIARKGETLIAVLRYLLDTVKVNVNTIKNLIMNITTDEKTGKKLADDTTLAPILNNVFTQINASTTDQLIMAVYYLLIGENTDAYWNFTNYKTKTNTFKFPDGVNEATVAKLVSFLDGIIEEVDLNALLNQYLYTDSIINALAKAMYTGIDNVKISDTIKLSDLLAIADIKMDFNSVVAMLSDSRYGETKQFESAVAVMKAAGSWSAVDFDKLTWGVKDQETFLKALVAVLRPFEGIIDVLLADGQLNLLEGIVIPGSNDYVNSIVPLLEAFRCDGIKSYDKYLADKEKAYDALLLDVLTPLFGFVNDVVANPIGTLASVLPNVALFIGNDGLVQLVENLLTPIIELVKQLNPIIDVDKLLQDLTKISNISVTNIGKFIEPFVGGGNLIALANKYLAAIGIQIPEIDWLGLASLGTTKNEASAVTCIGKRIVVDGNSSQVIVAVLRYVLDVVLDNQVAIKGLIGKSYTGTLKDILDMVFAMSSDDLLKLVFSLVEITQSPTEVYWAYENYKSKISNFEYPNGITAEDAENAVAQLDNAVNGVFALLQGVGVVDSSNLTGLVNDLLFTNEILTQLAVELYGALGSEKVAPYMEMVGIAVSPKDVAALLTDKSYGKTFSSAAKTIGSKSSWSKLKTVKKDKDGKETKTYANINWGFTNGAANAEQGFINALTAILRPFLDILGPFLNGTDLALGDILYGVVTKLDINSGDQSKGETLVTLKDGMLTIKTQSNGVYSTAFELNLSNLVTLKDLNLCGENGYENAIIPLLDVLQVENSEIKTYDEYVKDCKKAKDNILLDVLNPLMSFIDKVLEAPFDTITSVLPNLAYFIGNNGIGQLLDNILSPITEWLKGAKADGLDIDKILKIALGKDLGTMLTEMLKMKNVKLNVKLADLSSCNIQDIVVPLLNSLLKKTGIKIPEFKWLTIASHGEVVTSKSKAENSKGKFTNKEVIADKGETLVAVLRYVADILTTNAKTLKSLIGSIDAIKKNDTIKSVINSIFNTISTSSNDSIVLAVFYFLCGEPTNAFWDYTAYETGEYTFTYPESVDTDFLKNLPPMLDGLIGGLADLNGLIGDALFKDELVSKLAVGLYGAIEKVSISGDTNLTDLLAMTDIDFSTDNVAKLLVDENYGQTFESAASVIKNAGSWTKISTDSLKWGVTDRDSFFHALVAVLRPIYGVLDVLLNDANLGLFDIVRIPGSNGYTSSIVPLMEAFSMYNIKTQYQYREDINEAYDNILLDIINPLWDLVEDLLNAPLQVLAAIIPNLALFIGNDGLVQIIDNLLTPVSALVDAIKPVVDLNDLLDVVFEALDVDLGSLLGKIGITNFSLDIYDLNATLKPLLGGDALIPLINNILGIIEIGGQPLGLKLNDVDWLQLASHGKTIVAASQAATYGSRIYVEGDSSETLIAVLRYLIETVNAGDNFDKISSLIGGLLGDGVSDSVSDVINQVLGALQGDTDEVIASLVDLLQMLA